MTIHNSLKQYRIEKNLTQEELAAAVGVSRQTIIAMEKGNYTPSLLLALQLANHFNVRVDQVFKLQLD
ncbi:MAG: helix-turn-helix transcriptional regulator [Candidatus Doudnabacteria bacterium]|nr:helix-turn-helix transcriptional regulator [Candidatus Doudnabacteria bacterium]